MCVLDVLGIDCAWDVSCCHVVECSLFTGALSCAIKEAKLEWNETLCVLVKLRGVGKRLHGR